MRSDKNYSLFISQPSDAARNGEHIFVIHAACRLGQP